MSWNKFARKKIFGEEPTESSVLVQWLVDFFKKSIRSISHEQDRLEVLDWLVLVRAILNNSELSKLNKAKQIYAISDSKKTIKIIFKSLAETVKNYKNSDMPLAVKVALPVTLSAAAFFGGQGAGIAAFGTAFGVPVLLMILLGTAGITAILESFIQYKDSRSYIGAVSALIIRDQIYLQANRKLQEAMLSNQLEPKHFDVPNEELALRAYLLQMDPYEFEQHVMSFFQKKGMLSWVTTKSNDAGVDGFAKHSEGLIVVQCKRFAEHNLVGRPVIQQFKGVIEENSAYEGYIVTTSSFTKEAVESAGKNERLKLIDMNILVGWHLN